MATCNLLRVVYFLFFEILLPYFFDAKSFLESLILAQSERWRRGLGMQVERFPQGNSGRRVSNT